MKQRVILAGAKPILVKYKLKIPKGKRVTFFLLGSVERGFIPPRKMLMEFSDNLKKALNSLDHPIIITHPFLTVMQVDLPKDSYVYVGSQEEDKKDG